MRLALYNRSPEGWELVARKDDLARIIQANPGAIWYDHFAAELCVFRSDDPDMLESLSVNAGLGVPPRINLSRKVATHKQSGNS